jgi:predicted RNA-binding protein with PIN domain
MLPCHNAEEIILERGYDPESDAKNLSSSVFCKAGAGYSVPWYEADGLMHLKDGDDLPEDARDDYIPPRARATVYRGTAEEDKELMRIFEATYGKVKPRTVSEKKENSAPERKERPAKQKPKGDDYIVIDGYNVIYAIEELRRAAESDFALARDVLIRMTCEYCAFRRCKGMIVFDAYRRKGNEGSEETVGAVKVIYTKEGQTADSYIEKKTYELAAEHTVRVVTSDLEEQNVILGNGALRMSVEEFRQEMECVRGEIREAIDYYKTKKK